MTSRMLATFLGLGCLALASGVSQAQIRLDRPLGGGQPAPTATPAGGMIASITAAQMVQVLSQAGYQKGQVLEMKNNFRGAKFDLNGTPVIVILGNCSGDSCANYTYFTFFGKQNVTPQFVNAYNYQRSFGKLYTDKDGELVLCMEGFLVGGVTTSYVASTGLTYGSVLKGLLEFKPE